MCWPAALAGLSSLGIGGATAAGATAAAGAGIGGALQTIGLVASVGGSLAQGIAANNAAKVQAGMIEKQAAIETQLNATEDNRRRSEFKSQIAMQRAELASKNVQLDSPTAVLLGQVAASEMSFESQAVRQGGQARQDELSASKAAALAEGKNSILKGTFTAAGSALSGAQDIWPGLKANRARN